MSTAGAAGASDGLGVVVVHYGDPGPTLACLASIAGDPSAVGRAVVVVDNSANLSVGAGVVGAGAGGARPSTVVVLPGPDNPGFGTAANRGASLLAERGSLAGYVLLNGDVELLPGFLAAAAAAFADGAGAVGGPLYLDREGGDLWYAGGRIDRLTGTVRQQRTVADATRAREVSFIPGTAIAVSTPAWQAAGGFDPTFFLYNEDVDLCLRLARAGFHLRFEPAMRAVHRVGGATGSRGRSALYLEHLTRTRLLPYPSRTHRLWLALLHTGWVSIRAATLLLRRGRAGAPFLAALLRGHRDALASVWSRHLPAKG